MDGCSIARYRREAVSCFAAAWVLPVAVSPIANGAVAIREGRVLAAGARLELEKLYPESEWFDLGNSAIMPGLVNAHSHLELTAMRGLLEHSDFRAWIEALTDIKLTRMTHADLFDSARLGALEAVRAGITACADTCDTGVALDALAEIGLGGAVYQEVFGPDPAQCHDSLAKLCDKVAALSERAQGSNVAVGVSPHAPYTVSAALFRAVADYAGTNALPVAIHAAESDAEEQFVRHGGGTFADRLSARGIDWPAQGVSTVGYLERLGVLETRPLLIHAIRVPDEEMDAIARTGSTVAHCPKSNAKFGHGIARVAAMLERGIAVGIGTDSVASNNVCDVLDEGRIAALSARAAEHDAAAMTARDVISMTTLGGARAIGQGGEIGSLEPGKRADLCAIGLDGLHVAPVYDVETALVFSASRHDVTMTMADGRIVYATYPGHEPPVDEERLRARLSEIRRRIANP